MQSSMVNPNPIEKLMDSVVVVENAGGGLPLLYGIPNSQHSFTYLWKYSESSILISLISIVKSEFLYDFTIANTTQQQ
jgi:hypothetical protein